MHTRHVAGFAFDGGGEHERLVMTARRFSGRRIDGQAIAAHDDGARVRQRGGVLVGRPFEMFPHGGRRLNLEVSEDRPSVGVSGIVRHGGAGTDDA